MESFAKDDYFESQQKRIERDLASFADPGTLVEVLGEPRSFDGHWTMRGSCREAHFSQSPAQGIRVSVGSNKKQSYQSFLADEPMANLRHVATMMVQAMSRGAQDVFVPTQARSQGKQGTATEHLKELIRGEGSGKTRVIMVTGEAGAGKTNVLRRLVRDQADLYLRGQTGMLFLYVNAQGRSLARLDEAFATELQDLRVGLTYHSIETLARVGILVPIIDGFDELLGVSGYDDPFNSLAGLLDGLDGEGGLIASARSAYYEAEFLARAGRASSDARQSWEQIAVEISGWEDQEQSLFLDGLAQSDQRRDDLKKKLSAAFGDHDELARKPFFFSRVAHLVLNDELPEDEDLLSALAQGYLQRELNEKLLDRQQAPLLGLEQLELLMRELAQEMWSQETRELDQGSVREVADYLSELLGLEEAARSVIVERVPTLAFLAHNDRHQRTLFEHEVFFCYFLARSLVHQYLRKEDMRLALSRSALPELVAERIAIELYGKEVLSSSDGLQAVLDRLAEAGSQQWLRTAQVRENAGIVVLALLREYAGRRPGGVIEDVIIRAVTLPGSHLHDVVLKRCRLVDVAIRRVDLSRTIFEDCQAVNLTMVEPVVKVGEGGTRLGLQGLNRAELVAGLVVLEEDGRRESFAPQKVAAILRECGAPMMAGEQGDGRDVPDGAMELLDKVVRAYGRTNPICEDDRGLKGVVADVWWDTVRALLVKHGLVQEETRPTGGTRKRFLRRRFAPGELMAGASRRRCSDRAIAKFWDDLEAAEAP